MSEPTRENPKTSKRSKRKPAMAPLGWDEIVSQPGMGGYLSFLNGPVPLPHLQSAGTAPAPDPGVVSRPGIEPASVFVPVPVPDAEPVHDRESVLGSPSGSAPIPGVVSDTQFNSAPEHFTASAVVPAPDVINKRTAPGPILAPGVISVPVPAHGPRLHIRKCAAAHDGHSLGEEVLYQAMWKAARPESAETRTIVIGWRGMSQLCRMTPKNCKINTQRLIRKLALEVLSPYNTPESIGTTYRVYSDQAIFERRRRAGLEWVVRSRGVEFVDPATVSSG